MGKFWINKGGHRIYIRDDVPLSLMTCTDYTWETKKSSPALHTEVTAWKQ